MPTAELGVSFSILKFQFLRTKPIRSQLVTDTGRFLASLFTFLSRWPIVNQLRASGRNYYYNYNKREKKRVIFLHCLSLHYTVLKNVVSPTCKWTSGN